MKLSIALFAVLLADPKADVLKKLDGAKTDYREVETLHRKSIEKAFDAMEEAARKDGSKKAVDAAKQNREVFKLWGEYPASVPRAAMADARARLIKAYQDAISGLIMAKADAEAEKLEKEFNKFRIESAVLAGKYTYLSKLKAFNVKSNNNWFTTNGTMPETKLPLKFKDLPVPHSIYHANKTGDYVAAFYNLAGKYHTFRAVVGVPRVSDGGENPVGGPYFAASSEGKTLWKSKPVERVEDFQTVEVNVEKVSWSSRSIAQGPATGPEPSGSSRFSSSPESIRRPLDLRQSFPESGDFGVLFANPFPRGVELVILRAKLV